MGEIYKNIFQKYALKFLIRIDTVVFHIRSLQFIFQGRSVSSNVSGGLTCDSWKQRLPERNFLITCKTQPQFACSLPPDTDYVEIHLLLLMLVKYLILSLSAIPFYLSCHQSSFLILINTPLIVLQLCVKRSILKSHLK